MYPSTSSRRKHRSKRRKKKVIINDSSEEFIDDTYVPSLHANCSCCDDNFGEEMYECCECHRKYHNYCHIPIILPSEKRKKPWKCTMCLDMNTISRDLDEESVLENISANAVVRKIAERLLMECYCYIGSDIFREQPNIKVWPEIYDCTVCVITLDVVKYFMMNNKNYKLSKVVEDIKQVFINAMSFYELGDPNFNLAKKLLNHLLILYRKWIVLPTRNNQRTVVSSE